jgi:hypothetical protein
MKRELDHANMGEAYAGKRGWVSHETFADATLDDRKWAY